MQQLKVAFLDFWPEINYENIFLPILQKHFEVEITTQNPDIVIHSIFNEMQDTPKYKCKKILFLGENYNPVLFKSDYSISFMPHSETNYRLPLWQYFLILNPDMKTCLFGNRIQHKNFDRFCSFTVSNPYNFIRNSAYDQLSSYKKVHSYGRFKTNDLALQKLSNGIYWRDAKYKFFNLIKHKFSLVFENNGHPWYCTEKLMDSFLAGSLPIYWGDTKVKEDWNTEAFIYISNYENWLKKIKELDENSQLFDSYYNKPIFTEEQRKKHLKNLENFENWLIEIIK